MKTRKPNKNFAVSNSRKQIKIFTVLNALKKNDIEKTARAPADENAKPSCRL
jgi:hypothetical protein